MNLKQSIVLPPSMDSWDKLQSFIEQFCMQHRITQEHYLTIQLVCEEWFTNIIMHGYRITDAKGMQHGQQQIIRIELWMERQDEFVVRFTDSAPAFNPLNHERPDVSLSAEDRSIGGLGIFLITTKMDHCHYERIGGKNVFTMMKKIRVLT